MKPETRAVIAELRVVADQQRLPGMARVGINVDRALGVSIPALRKIGRRHRPDHSLALDLWRSGIHEARILASMVDDPAEVTRDQMEEWVGDFDSWDLCDQVISNLFDLTPFAASVVRAWTKRPDEFVKRAGFAMIAAHAVHDRMAPDRSFTAWFPAIRRGATDDRNYVKKAVSWGSARSASGTWSSTRRPSRRRRCWRRPISPARAGSVAMRCASCEATRGSGDYWPLRRNRP
jgi:3-methyladenine DNA glycosylase AlkD